MTTEGKLILRLLPVINSQFRMISSIENLKFTVQLKPLGCGTSITSFSYVLCAFDTHSIVPIKNFDSLQVLLYDEFAKSCLSKHFLDFFRVHSL